MNFARSLRTPSILQQLLAVYFANIYSWHVLSSEMSIVGKINLSICFKNFTDFDFFYTDFFFIFFYAKRMLYSEQPTVLAWRHLNTMLLTNFENLNSTSNIFQETHDFLVLTEILIYNWYKVSFMN